MPATHILPRRAVLGLALGLGTACLAPMAWADMAEVSAPGGIALGGYDAVAYFTEGRAVKGTSAHALKWRGAMWYFASPETMEAFEMNPLGYAPQYGGYSAYAVATGTTVAADPKVFSIIEGRLFLNNSTSVQEIWNSDPAGNISRADTNWLALNGR